MGTFWLRNQDACVCFFRAVVSLGKEIWPHVLSPPADFKLVQVLPTEETKGFATWWDVFVNMVAPRVKVTMRNREMNLGSGPASAFTLLCMTLGGFDSLGLSFPGC